MDLDFYKNQIHSTHFKTDEEARRLLFNICCDLIDEIEKGIKKCSASDIRKRNGVKPLSGKRLTDL